MKAKNQKILKEIAASLKRHNRFLLACHERAEGDALGSLLALGLGLESLGKSVVMYSPDGVPELYRFLPQQEKITAFLPSHTQENIEVVACLDCDGLARARGLAQWLQSHHLLIDIDHHDPEKGFGDLQLIVPEASATAIIIYHLFQEMGIPIDAKMAACLLTAIYLDTGSFRYENVTEEAFQIGGHLMRLGAQPAEIAGWLYSTRSLPAIKLLGRALSKAQTTSKIIYATLSAQDFAESGAHREDTEGIIDLLRTSQEALIAALFIQQADSEVKVSLRSKGDVNVATIASQHRGGGHPRAAGFDMPGKLEELVEVVINELQKLLH